MTELDARHAMGANFPPEDEIPLKDLPLDAQLEIETTALKQRADDLVASAGRAAVIDYETSQKATLLVGMIKKAAASLEEARVARKEPFLESGRVVDQHFRRIGEQLVGSDLKKLGGAGGAVAAMVDKFRKDQEAAAAAERAKLQEEARLAQQAVEDAQRKANEAALPSGALRIDDEIEVLELAQQANQLAKQASEVRPTAIDSGYGVKASARKVWKAVITDLTVALKHARKVNEPVVQEAVQKIYDAQVRAGVRTLPGAAVSEDSVTQFRG